MILTNDLLLGILIGRCPHCPDPTGIEARQPPDASWLFALYRHRGLHFCGAGVHWHHSISGVLMSITLMGGIDTAGLCRCWSPLW